MAVEWKNGYSAIYYATVVDPKTWADLNRIELLGGTISRDYSTELVESADLDCKNYNETQEQWIRVWLDTKQGANSSHTALFTGLAISPSKTINGQSITETVQCYSVLKPAQDILLDRGYYAPIDTDGGYLIQSLLNCINSPVEISEELSDNRKLTQSIIAEAGENHLSMVNKILYIMNWRIKIDGTGEVWVGPYSKEPVIIFDNLDNDMIETSINYTYDWYDCPNVVRAVMDDRVAIARDDSDTSPLSTVSRGREIWYEESDCLLNDKETLDEYAKRRLNELQRVAAKMSYDRRYHPDVYPSDVIRIHYPNQGVQGDYMVSSHNIELGYSARTSEEVVQV